MRVLWFTNTLANYRIDTSDGYNGGGWISSVETAMRRYGHVELAVSFIMDGQPEKHYDGQVTYYPMPDIRISLLRKMKYKLQPRGDELLERAKWTLYEQKMLRVVQDFKPDIIEVFGSEKYYGLIAKRVNVPVVLHIQGILNPYLNAFLPPLVSWHDFYLEELNPFKIYKRIMSRKGWVLACMREKEILHRVSHYIGRTAWDERVTKVLNPQANYYYGSEVLRPAFYIDKERQMPAKFTIVSTISQPLYKGYDMALKTARLMKNLNVDFQWLMFGNIAPLIAEKRVGIRHDDVNIRLCGVATAEQLRDALLSCSVYVHTSYIDNSPNSLCEAQMMGCPVIATNVGGVSSLIEDGKTGFLVPANDPYQMSYLLCVLQQDSEQNLAMGRKARQTAIQRHDPQSIVCTLLDIYNEIIVHHTC